MRFSNSLDRLAQAEEVIFRLHDLSRTAPLTGSWLSQYPPFDTRPLLKGFLISMISIEPLAPTSMGQCIASPAPRAATANPTTAADRLPAATWLRSVVPLRVGAIVTSSSPQREHPYQDPFRAKELVSGMNLLHPGNPPHDHTDDDEKHRPGDHPVCDEAVFVRRIREAAIRGVADLMWDSADSK